MPTTTTLPADLAARYAPSGEAGAPSSPAHIPLFFGPSCWLAEYLPALGNAHAARRFLAPLMPSLMADGLVTGNRHTGYFTDCPGELAAAVRRLLADPKTRAHNLSRRVRAVLDSPPTAPYGETFLCRDCGQRRPVEGRVAYRCADCATRAIERASTSKTPAMAAPWPDLRR
ncbi:hypothetical protein [Cupriavidus sp. Agwp_2]|uniref:hypothetical protein n=1 Tax=Cupriavidus sp. Agwp_2 TaxID=2897324 RepID=UPI00345F9595